MPKIIKNGRIVDDAWQVLKLAEGETPASVALPGGEVLVPLPVWQARRDEILARGVPAGVWLDAGEGPEAIAADLGHFAVVAVNFPKFADGRGYSTARLLRERYGFKGEVRAVGDVLREQAGFMVRVGFDAFEPADGSTPEQWAHTAHRHRHVYQRAADRRAPAFAERE